MNEIPTKGRVYTHTSMRFSSLPISSASSVIQLFLNTNGLKYNKMIASFPGHSQILSHSCGKKLVVIAAVRKNLGVAGI